MTEGPGRQDPLQQPPIQPGQAPSAAMHQQVPGASPPQEPWQGPPPQQAPWQGLSTAQPPRRRKGGRVVAEVVGGVVLLSFGVAIGGAGKNAPGGAPVAASSHPAHAAAASAPATSAAPAPTASPDGTYQGACDYTLNNNLNSSTAAVATGDVQVNNTGNIGTIVKVTITWPQQGYAPLAMTKKIHLAAGANTDVQFHLPLNDNQISNLQNWQSGHNYNSGCTYNAKIIGTFGQPS